MSSDFEGWLRKGGPGRPLRAVMLEQAAAALADQVLNAEAAFRAAEFDPGSYYIAEMIVKARAVREALASAHVADASAGGFLVPAVTRVDVSSRLRRFFVRLHIVRPKIEVRHPAQELRAALAQIAREQAPLHPNSENH